MKFAIKHEIKGRLRVHMAQQRMTYEQADVLQYYLQQSDLVDRCKGIRTDSGRCDQLQRRQGCYYSFIVYLQISVSRSTGRISGEYRT